MEKIEITIGKDASIEYEVSGVKGKSCTDLTKAIDEISGKVLESEKTAEYHQAEEKQHVKNSN